MDTSTYIDISNQITGERNDLTDEGINDKKWTANQDKSIRTGRTITQKSEVGTMLWEAIARGNEKWQLPISSVCGADCLFCASKYNPMDMNLASGFRDLEDIKQAICLLHGGQQPIQLGGESNGVVRQEGEPLLHPKIFEIFKLIREKHPTCPILVSTNATQLTEKFVKQLTDFRPLQFQISYHSNNQHNWCKIFGIRAKKFQIAQNCFPLLSHYGFGCQLSVVAMPNLVGYDDIEATINYLSHYTREINIWSPHYTEAENTHYENFRHSLSYNSEEMSEFLTKMRKKYNIIIDWPLDPLKPINLGGFKSIFTPLPIMQDFYYEERKNSLWLLSEAAWIRGAGKIIKEASSYVPDYHTAVFVKNTTYGGTITCAGLLMVDDFDKAIEKTFKENPQLRDKINSCVIPGLPFNRFGEDMLGKKYSVLQEKYNISIVEVPKENPNFI